MTWDASLGKAKLNEDLLLHDYVLTRPVSPTFSTCLATNMHISNVFQWVKNIKYSDDLIKNKYVFRFFKNLVCFLSYACMNYNPECRLCDYIQGSHMGF